MFPLLALRTKGGGEAVVSSLLAELQTQQVYGGLGLDQAKLLTNPIPLGRGCCLQGVSAGAPNFNRVLPSNLEGACFVILRLHLRNRPFVNQNSRLPFSFQISTQSTEGAGEGVRPSTGERVQVRVTLRKVRFSDSPSDNSGLLG
jgi:hypothetical protein